MIYCMLSLILSNSIKQNELEETPNTHSIKIKELEERLSQQQSVFQNQQESNK